MRPAGAASVGPSLALTLALCLQEAAAIIAQRPDNPREFFKQQERVASASAGSCDVPSPFNHRPGSPRSHPHLAPTPQVLALSLFGALSWKGSLAQGPMETARLFIKCASTHCLPGGRTEKAGLGEVDVGPWLSRGPATGHLDSFGMGEGAPWLWGVEWPCWG